MLQELSRYGGKEEKMLRGINGSMEEERHVQFLSETNWHRKVKTKCTFIVFSKLHGAFRLAKQEPELQPANTIHPVVLFSIRI